MDNNDNIIEKNDEKNIGKKTNALMQLIQIYFTMAKIGMFTFGGGLAMMPMMQTELIQKRQWITDEELMDYYAIGQSTPGIVAVNVSTFVGYKLAGILGGIVGTLGMVTPSLIIIMILAGLINSIDDIPAAQKAMKGINVAVAALLTTVIVRFAKKSVKNLAGAVLMAVSFVLVFVFKLPTFIIILAVIAGGVIYAACTSKSINKSINKEEK